MADIAALRRVFDAFEAARIPAIEFSWAFNCLPIGRRHSGMAAYEPVEYQQREDRVIATIPALTQALQQIEESPLAVAGSCVAESTGCSQIQWARSVLETVKALKADVDSVSLFYGDGGRIHGWLHLMDGYHNDVRLEMQLRSEVETAPPDPSIGKSGVVEYVAAGRKWRFEPGCCFCGGVRIELKGKPWNVLLETVKHQGIATAKMLLDKIWGEDAFIQEGSVKNHVFAVRDALRRDLKLSHDPFPAVDRGSANLAWRLKMEPPISKKTEKKPKRDAG